MEYAFLDANVILRYLLRDDEIKAQHCLELLERLREGRLLFIPRI
jgi:predicted nucleic acid-binding protein